LGTARGYLNRPGLTKEKFIQNPFIQGDRIYKSGDMARWLPDGDIEFLGRFDQQVKIRGFRIELGEIETQLVNHPAIKKALVIHREEDNGNKYLCAYIVSHIEITVSAIREYLLMHLPAYMVPPYFYQLEKIPLTSNGKVDIQALNSISSTIKTDVVYEAPANELEKKLAAIWKEILRLEKIGIHDNFFELGGNSISLLKAAAAIKREFNLEISVVQLLLNATIRQLSGQILNERHGKTIKATFYGKFVQLNNHNDTYSNLFCFPPGIAVGVAYMNLAQKLSGHNIYSFNFIEEDRICQYANTIMEIQPEGPYCLFGFSGGGNLAFETAQFLEQQGESVSDIIILDSSYRLEPLIFPSDRSRDNDNNFLDRLHAAMDQFGLGHLKEKLAEKMDKYFVYHHQQVESGKVNAHIHLITSANREEKQAQIKNQNPQVREKLDWQGAGASRSFYEGFGPHENMISVEYVEKNAAIIQNILNEITERKKNKQK